MWSNKVERIQSAVIVSALAMALLTLFSTSVDAEGKVVEAPANVKTHGITHCELKPQACAPICGTASPICEMGGQCICRAGPHKTGPVCKEPEEGLEAKRCHRNLCLKTKITKPLVCQLTKKLKFCACFPEQSENII